MKKNQFASLYIVTLCLLTIGSLYLPHVEAKVTSETMIIPNEAIRLRILANSDSEQDQQIKRDIRDEVNVNITEWVADLTSLDEARNVIKSHLGDIQEIAESYVEKHGVEQSVKVEFGSAQFPTKLYGQYLYPAGEYEAIVITLGEGSGANWWCVLFPPLCFLDFANGTAVSMTPMEEDAEQEEQVKEEQVKEIDSNEEKVEENQVTQVNLEIEKNESTEVTQTGLEVKRNENVEEALQAMEENEVFEETEESPIYVEQDEEVQVLEKRIFIVEVWNGLFSNE